MGSEEKKAEDQIKDDREKQNNKMDASHGTVIWGPEPMNFDDSGKHWTTWEQRFKIYLLASGKNNESEDIKIALFLHHIGEKGLDIYNSFNLKPEEATLENVIKKFEMYCTPKKNVVMETFKFHNITQQPGQPFCEFETELRKQIKFCEFECSDTCKKFEDRMLCDKIILGVCDKNLQVRLLESKENDLNVIIEKCKVAELAEKNKKTLEETKENKIDAVHGATKKTEFNKKEQICFSCGGAWTREHRESCPALKPGRKCIKCKQPGHFASMCRNKGNKKQSRVNVVTAMDDDGKQKLEYFEEGKNVDDCHINNFKLIKINNVLDCSINGEGGGWFKSVSVNGLPIKFKMDTGADISCLPIIYIKKLNVESFIVKSNNRLFAYNNLEIKTFGKIKLSCVINRVKCITPIEFEVVSNELQPILGRDACVTLNLIRKVDNVYCKKIQNASGASSSVSDCEVKYKKLLQGLPDDKEEFIKNNLDVFDGLGQIPGKCVIELKENSKPRLNYKKKIPFSLHDRLKKHLNIMVSDGVISRVNKPTDWVNNLQIVEKPSGELRICLDPKPLNECIKRERCIIPTAESIMGRLNGARYFTVMDLKNGFWQLVLDENCSELTTFITPFGLYKWNRMPFGLNNAPEVFMRYMIQIFGDIEGVEIYFDDLCITGVTKKEHDERLIKVIKRAQEFNIKFNKRKIQYRTTEVCFMGQRISNGKIRPDLKYLRAIREMPVPNNKRDVMRILGMCKFLSRYIPNLSASTANLRELTKNNVKWQWNIQHVQEFENIKGIISTSPVLRIYDPKLPIVIQTDASKDGIGCVLLQNGQPVAFASRSLTESEKRWAQIEKELLAVVVAGEKFHYYIYGREFEVHSDHKPLETLIKRDLDKVTARLQRMFMLLLKYPGLTLKYVPGKEMLLADCLSRAYLPEIGQDDPALKHMVHTIITRVCISDNNKELFIRATHMDECLKNVMTYLSGNWPEYKKLNIEEKKFHKIKNELSIGYGLLFFRDKLVVPQELRMQTLRLLHSAHLGIEKTRMRARELYYWPGLSTEIEKFISGCRICEKFRRKNQKEPLQQHSEPMYPWEQVAIDIFDYGGLSYLAIVDSYSGWLCSEKLKNKSINEVINVLEGLFTKFGIPTEIRSDNVPFNSYQFTKFANECNFKVKFSSPNYPQSNGLAEKAVSIAKNILKKNLRDGKNDYQFQILEYNVSPLQDMLLSPAQMFMGRILKTKLPISENLLNKEVVNKCEIRNRIISKRKRQKIYYDQSARPLSRLINNDSVLFLKNNEWVYGTIINKYNNRSYIIKDENGNTFRRNRKYVITTKNGIKNEIIDEDVIDNSLSNKNENVNINQNNNNNSDKPSNEMLSQSNYGDNMGENTTINVNNNTSATTNDQTYVTRFGRIVREPQRYGEWVE